MSQGIEFGEAKGIVIAKYIYFVSSAALRCTQARNPKINPFECFLQWIYFSDTATLFSVFCTFIEAVGPLWST